MARDQLIQQILAHLLTMGADVDRLTGAAAGVNRINRTDLRALKVLRGGAGVTAGDLARTLHVTSGATTRVIDSLVAAGHVVREIDRRDRRRVLVKLTPAAADLVDRTFAELRAALLAALETYRDEELQTLARFLADVSTVVRAHASWLDRHRP